LTGCAAAREESAHACVTRREVGRGSKKAAVARVVPPGAQELEIGVPDFVESIHGVRDPRGACARNGRAAAAHRLGECVEVVDVAGYNLQQRLRLSTLLQLVQYCKVWRVRGK